ncbi:hypothetical protein CF68_33205 [Cupriavidus sp. SK-4]|uniref:hypothetical protein n=1 Tax=Cupriavidus sp. SK-4 TaxID=574750 RepID=UPI0004465117|nr:hypothetical protein [Cupriavidus sp. SK-4]EYS89485.1 hypothetical protein CF68_33205 [Cupriavidus sp. SK-4]
MKAILIAGAVAIGLVGCAAPPPLYTDSGKPEVSIPNTNRRQVIDAIVDMAHQSEARVKSATDYSVVLGRKMDGNSAGDFVAAVLFGSNYDRTPEARTTFNVLELSGGTKVYASADLVTNPGSAFERTQNLTAGKGPELMNFLARLKARFASSEQPAAPGPAAQALGSPQINQVRQPVVAAKPSPGPFSSMAEELALRDMCTPVGYALRTATSQAGDTYRVNCMGGMVKEYACAGQSCLPAR